METPGAARRRGRGGVGCSIGPVSAAA